MHPGAVNLERLERPAQLAVGVLAVTDQRRLSLFKDREQPAWVGAVNRELFAIRELDVGEEALVATEQLRELPLGLAVCHAKPGRPQ